MEADARGKLAHPRADLEQAQAQGIELQRRVTLAAQPAAQRVEQPIGGGMQQQAELISPETAVAQAIRDAGALEILDPEFRFAAIDIEVSPAARRDHRR